MTGHVDMMPGYHIDNLCDLRWEPALRRQGDLG